MKSLFLTIICILSVAISNGQSNSDDQSDTTGAELIQFSGVVLDDSLGAIPYAYIYEKHSRRGTLSDYYGYFSFVAEKGDTIVFSSIAYEDAEFIIPDTLTSFRFSIIQMLYLSTTQLKTQEVYPWPSKEEFVEAFMDLEVSNQYDIAQRNLKRQELAAQAQGVGNDSYLNYKNTLRQQQQKIYYAGQAPPNNLLNPIAWAQFIQAWKNGELKQK